MKIPMTAVVLTFNEALNLEKCLKSLSGWIGEIYVVDSYSTDATLQIAKNYGAKIFQNKFVSHPNQWSWLLKNLPFVHEWVFAVDADFVISDELRYFLIKEFANEDAIKIIHGYYVKHCQMFFGKKIRFGGVYRHWLRIFRHREVVVDTYDLVDTHFNVNGFAKKINCDVIEDNQKDCNMGFWIDKQNRFSQNAAKEELIRRTNARSWPIRGVLFGLPNERIIFFKKFWMRLPLYLRSIGYFLYRYFFLLGFLDGRAGFLYHFSQGFLYRLLVDIELDALLFELEAKKTSKHNASDYSWN